MKWEIEAPQHKAYCKALADYDFSTGNVISNAQYSTFVRAGTQTSCNGLEREFLHGALQDFDLKPSGNSLPSHVRSSVKRLLNNRMGVLYHVRHYTKGKLVSHGWFLTDYHGGEVLFRTYPVSRKSESCMAYAIARVGAEAIRSNTRRAEDCFGHTLIHMLTTGAMAPDHHEISC